MNVLFIGDIVGAPGREAIKRIVPQLRVELALDFVIANAENASGGSGITAKVADELFDAEVDVLTSGDHIWKKQEIFELINKQARILRPINYPVGAPGNGFGVFTASNGKKIGFPATVRVDRQRSSLQILPAYFFQSAAPSRSAYHNLGLQ